MNILVVGSGGREHTLLWKLAQSPQVSKLYCAPGNGGTRDLAQNVDIPVDNIDALLEFAQKEDMDLTVIGPELPLSLGLADAFQKEGLKVFGPNRSAARLESSKSFAKNFMNKYKIPTAKYAICHNFDEAIDAAKTFGFPVVLKADGLAAGKGVIIASNLNHARETIEEMQEGKFGSAGKTIVVEEFLTGPEVSVLAFVDGKRAVPMVSAQDYKRALDGDGGLNTGGMGSVSPALHYDVETSHIVQKEIIEITLEGLISEGIDYRGILYFGLMLTETGPKVIEFNARFGDPETQVVLPRLESDLVDIMKMVVDGNLDESKISWSSQKALGVVAASGGYPEDYLADFQITGLAHLPQDLMVFHAGTRYKDGKVFTSGGRVLTVTALGDDLEEIRSRIYNNLKRIHFQDMHYRTDIGKL